MKGRDPMYNRIKPSPIKPLVLLLILLLIPTFSLAEQTARRDVFEFSDLFMSRLYDIITDIGLDFDELDIVSARVMNPTKTDGLVWICNSAGIVLFHEDDFSIEEVMTTFFDESASDDSNRLHMLKFVSLLSALEFDTNENRSRFQSSIMNKYEASVIQESFAIFSSSIQGRINDAIDKALEIKDDVLIYSGNYDYYVCCEKWNSSVPLIVYISARERN